MTNPDDLIAHVLGQNAPPARDPVFRLQVMERRERQRFRRRSLMSVAAVAAIAGLSPLAIMAGGQAYAAGSVLLFALVLITGAVVYLPGFGRLLGRLSV